MPKAKAKTAVKEVDPVEVKTPASKAAAPSGSWFKKGAEGVQEKTRQDKVAKMRKEKSVPRFWLKVGETARVVFVDSEGFYIHEHNLEVDGKFGNYFTCTKDYTGECPIDTSTRKEKRAIWTGYYTIIDTRSFTKKDGTVVKNSKILFPAKSSAILMLDNLRKKHGSLAGVVIDATRYQDKDPNCGISFEYVGKVKDMVAKFGKDANTALDYEKILATPTDEEYAAIGLETVEVIGSHEDVKKNDEATDDLF